MAPTRKSRSVNKRYSFVSEVSPSKDGESSKKSTQRKRKLTDMLGSQWSKEELERFYEAYRKYGTDWKKVGAAVRHRSTEMVEALYMMNRAYLSLPEGTASVVGLKAMMTDHYSNLMGSDSEQESNDDNETSRKFQKRNRGSIPTKSSRRLEKKPISHTETSASNSDCLSLLKNPNGETRPRAVGKRTPRFPVSSSNEKVGGGKFYSPTREGLKLKANTDDDNVEHEVALALAEASQRGGSPPLSQISNRRTGSAMSSPIWNRERMGTELKLTHAKHLTGMDEVGLERRLGSRVGHIGEIARGKSFSMATEDTSNAIGKGRRIYVKKSDIGNGVNNRFDDIKESSKGVQNFGGEDEKVARHFSRKKSKQAPFSADEGSEFDALQTLADLSLLMPTSATEEDLSVHVEKKEDNIGGKHGILETDSAAQQCDRPKPFEVDSRANQSGCGASVAKMNGGFRKDSDIDRNGFLEVKEQPQQSMSRLSRKKQQMFISKIPRAEVHTVTHDSVPQEYETRDVGKQATSKSKLSPLGTSQQKQGKMIRYLEHSSPSTDIRGERRETALTTALIPVPNQAGIPGKARCRRKTEIKKPQNLKDLNKHDMLSNCLANERVRRWCMFEWFYSAIDYPWFAKREFVEYLKHVGLGDVPRLTRVEWGVIRSSLGKPRRFSEQFLKEEKEKLNQYRDSVRKTYGELREGTREGLPTDLARPLSVGQRVLAIHPKTREIHDGNVLTVDHDRCRVQFDQSELGVDFVLDIDCMPSNPSENMPASMDKLFPSFNEQRMSGRTNDLRLEGSLKLSSSELFQHVDVPLRLSPPYHSSNLVKQTKGTLNDSNLQAKMGVNEAGNGQQVVNNGQQVVNFALMAQMQAKEADVQALAELTRALEKKDLVLSELKHMNDASDGDNVLKNSESFKKQYAAIVLQLNAVNDQVSRALQDMRQRNAYHSSRPVVQKAVSIVGDSDEPLNSFKQQGNHVHEPEPHIHQIVESSRRKARTLVDSAMQAMSSLNTEETSLEGIGDAIDHISNRLSLDDSFVGATRPVAPANPVHGNLTLSTGSEPESKNALDTNEAQIPAELISHCVATFLMIQKCTERQFPPADVAQILDSAVVSLQPCSAQNMSVYGEIQTCMGIIRNQILALIP